MATRQSNKATNKATGNTRRRADWEAIERDYRTGKFTLRELEAKHAIAYASISRKATAEGWTKDLRDVIRRATDTALLQETTTKAQTEATNTILVAAEVNKQVILGHRSDIKATRDLAADLLAELRNAAMLVEHQELLAEILAGPDALPKEDFQARKTVARALDLGNRIAGIKALAETFTKLQALERQAFDLENTGTESADPLGDLLADIQKNRSALPIVERDVG